MSVRGLAGRSGGRASLACVWRTAIKPKWLALLGFVVLVLVIFAQLGLWQLNVARDTAHEEALAHSSSQPPIALTDALAPHQPMTSELAGRTVTVHGRYDPQLQVIVTDRRLDGQPGYWVVTPVTVEPGGAHLAVVRGFTTDPASVPAPQAGDVQLSGLLAPGESAPNEPKPLQPGQMQTVDLAELVNVWPGALYNAMLFPTDQVPAAPAGITHIPPPDLGSDGFAWRNLAYALQWWIFALFALYMWWRMVREEHERLALAAGGPPADEPPAPADLPEITDHAQTKERTP
ncbi:hypothetical protein KILIM_065_00110 [Kineosphaera limosa NBRC 100340]|uniref:SURF1-like protein n=1 Tax=Kineosphaera limosa NBRC 100340 TaxID=1184609 RepID=K6WDJ7_9MICO|nr:hypothetical protein KILIM_065_00110 [Kineosphaera limosa NBRC 100340]